jgi:signal transduction histidine kinase
MIADAPAIASLLPRWLVLGRMTAFDAYAQAVGTVMLIIALLLWLCSRYTDTRALRIFALLYLLTGIGWLVAHPRAHGSEADVPLLPAMVAVFLLGMNVWGLYEFLDLARRRAWALVAGTAAVGIGLAAWLQWGQRSALVVYGVIAAAFAYCAWLAARAAAREGNVGHHYVAAAFATYPLLFLVYLLLPSSLAGFDMGYYAAVPAMIVGMMMLAVSLIRARQRSEAELARRIAAEESLRQLNSTLEERVAARTRELNDLVDGLQSFNRNVSHDLRDPLAGLSGLAQLGAHALERDDKARARTLLETIQAQARQLAGMVLDLLQLSHLADAPLRRRPHALQRCVEAALEQLRLSPATAPALDLVPVEVQELPSCDIDPDLMRQVFVNLLGNALKFSVARGGGGYRVAVGLHHGPRGVAVCVEDNGVGLPAGREDELFKPFHRMHGELVAGSGIGLTVVRRIVEAHGGRIWAERVPAGGMRVLFTLAGLGGSDAPGQP